MSTDAVPPFLPACSFKAHWLGRLLEHSPIALLNAECLLAYWQAVARCLGWLRKLQFAIMDGRDAAESIKNGAGYDTSLGPRGENGAGSESVYSCSNPAIANISTPTGSHSISISMPSSPTALVVAKSNSVFSNDKTWTEANNAPSLPQRAHTKFHSQPMHVGFASANKSEQCFPRKQRLDDEKRFNLFKTWSGRFESRLSNMHIKSCDQVRIDDSKCREADILPAIDRYFDALEGPELETLKACEKLVLPKNKEWPFLLRFPINSFGMCLGLGSQAIMWKTLASSPSLSFLNISPNVNLVLWCIALALTALMAMIYSLKIIFFFEAVKREYYHPVRINFFFAPWISCLFLAIGIPPHVSTNLHTSLWYILMAPILCLEVKIYGQWMSGNRRLSKVANPSNHLSIVGNFVGALLGASMGIKEGPVFFFAIGLAHYIVLFVTLYQRLPTTETLPKELHPVFFLFIAAPSVACTSWAKITGKFDMGSRIAYFTAMFLYASLAVRINFFRGFRFSLAWWAYTFPMTGAAIATICYTDEVNSEITKTLAIVLSVVSTVAVSTLLISTTLHAFVLRNLFPNDIAIAITYKRTKSRKKNSRNRAPSSVVKGIEVCMSKDSPVL